MFTVSSEDNAKTCCKTHGRVIHYKVCSHVFCYKTWSETRSNLFCFKTCCKTRGWDDRNLHSRLPRDKTRVKIEHNCNIVGLFFSAAQPNMKEFRFCRCAFYDDTAQKLKFSIIDFFSKCDPIWSYLRISSHLLKNPLWKTFYAVWMKKVIWNRSLPLHKKWSFLLRISLVNVTKSAVSCKFGNIYWLILSGKFHFLCSAQCFK